MGGDLFLRREVREAEGGKGKGGLAPPNLKTKLRPCVYETLQ